MNRLWKLAQRNIQKIALKSGEGESEIDYSLLGLRFAATVECWGLWWNAKNEHVDVKFEVMV